MTKGDEYINVDTGQVWKIHSFDQMNAVMVWGDNLQTAQTFHWADVKKVFVPLPAGKKKLCYYRGLFAEWNEANLVAARRVRYDRWR